MPSSYTTSLRLTLPATGELAGQWGNTVNTGITELLDAAVAGTASISTWGGAGVAYTLSNNSGTADEARKMFIVATGTPGEAKNVICPAVSKFYVFRNDTTGGFALTLKTPSGTGIAVPAGQYKFLYCDGTNVVEMFNSAGALTLSGALSVGGTTTLASNPTLSAGTANQVQFLNASKVLSGSANLTFDGTTLTGAGFSGPLNGSVGATTPSTGAFTTLSASSTVSGTGFSTYLASPPAIGSTAANTGAFTTLSASSSVTLSGGAANGVLFLNGSKVATSGSALTFDGTNLATTGYAAGNGLRSLGGNPVRFYNAANANWSQISAPAGTGDMQFDTGAGEQMRLTSTGLGIGTSSPQRRLGIGGTANAYMNFNPTSNRQFTVGSDENGFIVYDDVATVYRMVLNTSGNLGIGTSSPAGKLDARGTGYIGSDSNNALFVDSTSTLVTIGAAGRTSFSTSALRFLTSDGTAALERMRLDSSGNLGLGVTPSAWSTTTSVFENPSGSIYSFSGNNQIGINSNAYYNGTNWIYRNASSVPAADYFLQNGQFVWRNAVAGTSGNTITFSEQMRLTSTGLGIGTSSPAAKLHVVGNQYRQNDSTGSFGFTLNTTSATTTLATLFGGSSFAIQTAGSGTNQLLLDSSGNLGLGVTPSAWNADYKAIQVGANGSIAGRVGTSNTFDLTSNGYRDNVGGDWRYIATNPVSRFSLDGSIGGFQWYTAPSGTAGNAISFTQALTLDANRNLLLNGTSAGASSVGTFTIFNGTAPTGSVTDGVILFAQDISSSSELRVRDEAGNVTTLSPHNFSLIPEGPSEEMAWAYYSEKGGKRINVDMLKLARMVEKLTGEKLVYES